MEGDVCWGLLRDGIDDRLYDSSNNWLLYLCVFVEIAGELAGIVPVLVDV